MPRVTTSRFHQADLSSRQLSLKALVLVPMYTGTCLDESDPVCRHIWQSLQTKVLVTHHSGSTQETACASEQIDERLVPRRRFFARNYLPGLRCLIRRCDLSR